MSVDITSFVTLEGIPICETGIDYPASTGDFSLTREMLGSAIEYTNDPHGVPPRIKIAHGDNPINADLQSLFEQYNEGRDASVPSLGTILNLSTINDGHTLIGDWYGLPEWFAEILASAYPARSLEGGVWENPANNKNYMFKIEAVSLLGVVGPGCTSMADLQELFSKEGPKVSVVEMTAPKSKKGASLSVPAVNLQVNVEDLRRQFYGEFAQGDRYWWWDRELLADPWEFVAADENGELWRIPFEPVEDDDGDTTVASWGEPEAIKISYVSDPKRVADGVEASVGLISPRLKKVGTLLAVNDKKPQRPALEQEGDGPRMAIDIPALRAATGLSTEDLPDDATEEQINEALAAKSSEAEDVVDDDEDDEDEVEAEATGDAPKPSTSPEANSRTMVVDREAFTAMQNDYNKRIKSERDDFIKAAVKSGKFSSEAGKAYRAELERGGDIESTMRATITSMPDNVIPVSEVGHSEGEESTTSMQGTGLFPELEKRRQAREEANA
jgi:hypothetical protein